MSAIGCGNLQFSYSLVLYERFFTTRSFKIKIDKRFTYREDDHRRCLSTATAPVKDFLRSVSIFGVDRPKCPNFFTHLSRVMVQLELKTLIFYYLGSEIPKSRSVMVFRGPPGPVCHTQKENSFSQFVRIR